MVYREKEIKLNLENENNYRLLVNHFKDRREIEQTNYFFDSPENVLSENGWVLRVRKLPDKYKIAAKGAASKGLKGLTVRPEIELDLAAETAETMIERGVLTRDIPAEIMNVFKDFLDTAHLSLIVDFVTTRTIIEYDAGAVPVQLEIDRTVYKDGSSDFELEIELPVIEAQDKVIEQIRALLERLNIPFIFQKESKFARGIKKLNLP
jgi:uncharacterized protein YjbK